ncbi:sigma-70 family RNA polymerase sigma factor [Patescibacteria group bacterium]|nr:sigma-70 family RNA polymerase sigma factor [Patescibacteria group bacterium]
MSSSETLLGMASIDESTSTLITPNTSEINSDTRIANERQYTLAEIEQILNVSKRTIDRWRNLPENEDPLQSEMTIVDGREKVVSTREQIESFRRNHSDRVAYAANFRQYSYDEKASVIDHLRMIIAKGTSLATSIKSAAEMSGMSIKTVRTILKQHNKAHPEDAILINTSNDRKIYDEYIDGTSSRDLAKKYKRSSYEIYRTIRREGHKHCSELQGAIDYMPNECFDEKDAEKEILGPQPPPSTSKLPKPLPALPSYLASLYKTPLLTREEEQYLFRRMNFQLHKAAKILNIVNSQETDPSKIRIADFLEFEQCLRDAESVRNRIWKANLRLVVSIAKRHANPDNFLELISDGNFSLFRAVCKFDYGRGNKFSIYASWAIMKNFSRSIPAGHRQMARFTTGCEHLEDIEDKRASDLTELEDDREQQDREVTVDELLGTLDDREREIIVRLFGLHQEKGGQTLKEIGAILGVTKERTRQIKCIAISKLKREADRQDVSVEDVLQL